MLCKRCFSKLVRLYVSDAYTVYIDICLQVDLLNLNRTSDYLPVDLLASTGTAVCVIQLYVQAVLQVVIARSTPHLVVHVYVP